MNYFESLTKKFVAIISKKKSHYKKEYQKYWFHLKLFSLTGKATDDDSNTECEAD